MIYELLWNYREDFHDNMLTILKKHCEDEDFNVSLYSNLLLENYSSDDSFEYTRTSKSYFDEIPNRGDKLFIKKNRSSPWINGYDCVMEQIALLSERLEVNGKHLEKRVADYSDKIPDTVQLIKLGRNWWGCKVVCENPNRSFLRVLYKDWYNHKFDWEEAELGRIVLSASEPYCLLVTPQLWTYNNGYLLNPPESFITASPVEQKKQLHDILFEGGDDTETVLAGGIIDYSHKEEIYGFITVKFVCHAMLQSKNDTVEETMDYQTDEQREFETEDGTSSDENDSSETSSEVAKSDDNVLENNDDSIVVQTEPDTISEIATEEEAKSLEGIPQDIIDLLDKSSELETYVYSYLEKKDMDFEIDLSEEAGMDDVPLLIQWDERWGYKQYGEGLIGYTGCGPTCLSMVAIYLTRDKTYTPVYVANYADEQGYYVKDQGTSWELMNTGCQAFGITAKTISPNEKEIKKYLDEGKAIICSVGPGDFTDKGHFIVIAGYKDEWFVINDPNSVEKSSKLWDFKTIRNQTKNLWVFSIK